MQIDFKGGKEPAVASNNEVDNRTGKNLTGLAHSIFHSFAHVAAAAEETDTLSHWLVAEMEVGSGSSGSLFGRVKKMGG